MSKTNYVFSLRQDMPPGFVENDTIPELPLVYNFLKQYQGQTFNSIRAFEEEMVKFSEWAEKQGREIPHWRWTPFPDKRGVVGVIENLSLCEFGTLEEIAREKRKSA